LANLQHQLALLDEFFLIGACLPNDFISMQAEDELWLSPDIVMNGDLGRDVAVDLDDFDIVVAVRDQIHMFFGYPACGVPFGCEVHQDVGVLVGFQVLVEDLQLTEVFDRAEPGY
jgi:lipopolysaccharide biosynthesis glycosyltransferase